MWKQRFGFSSLASSAAPSTTGSAVNLAEKYKTPAVDEKEVAAIAKEKEKPKKKKRSCGFGYWVSAKEDVEKTAEGPSIRPVRLFAPVYNGLGAALSICMYPFSVSVLNPEVLLAQSLSLVA